MIILLPVYLSWYELFKMGTFIHLNKSGSTLLKKKKKVRGATLYCPKHRDVNRN